MPGQDKSKIKITLYLPVGLDEQIQKAIKAGYYVSRSDLIRQAIRKELERLGITPQNQRKNR